MIRSPARHASAAWAGQRRALGLHFVPEERLGRGAVPTLGLAHNLLLTRTECRRRSGWIAGRRCERLANAIIERFNVKAGGPGAAAKSLSGGNLQKFIVGREIDANPKLLIVSQPTWGVDVGAAAQIRGEMLALRDAGCAVLVVSEELDELFEICDRLHVMAKGHLSPSVPRRRHGGADRRVDERPVARRRAGAAGPQPLQPHRPRRPPMFKLEPRPQPSKF
jgi:simple sugar transport system ATP-binding protein